MEASRKERDKRRRNKQIQFGVGIAAILAIIIFAGWAEISRIEAEEQSSLATARQLAAQSLNRPDDQFDLALLLSSKANDIRDDMETRASLFELLERNPRLITSLNSTSYAIEHAAFSPNGNVLISVSPDGGIQSWDISNSKPAIISLGGNSGYFPFSTLSPDGKMLALAEYTGRIVLWDVYADREIAKFGNYDQFSVLSLAFNPQSTLLASGHEDGTISLWDIGNHGSQNHGSQVELYSELPADDQWIADLAFSPDNKTLASASGSIRLWDVESGIEACPNITLENESTARCPRFSPNGKILAFGDIDGGIYIWNITTNQWQKLPMSHNGQVDSLAISRDGSLLASGGFDKTINLWDLKSGKLIDSTLRGHKLGIKSLEFSPDSRILASTGGLDHKIMLWDANIIPISRIGTLLTDRADPYSILASSLNGETLVSGGSDGKIIFWDSEKRKSIGVPLIQNGPVSTMEFNPNGTLLATGSGNGNITIWNVKTGQQIDLSYEGGVVQCLAFSHDSSKLASMDENHFIMWDTATKRSIFSQNLEEDMIASARPSVFLGPDDKLLASGDRYDTSGFYSAWIWGGEKRELLGNSEYSTLKHSGPISCIAFSPKGDMVATNGKPLDQLSGHMGSITSMSFSPDGVLLAVGSKDGAVTLWDIEGRKPFGQPLRGHSSDIYSLAFSQDNKILASSAIDGTIMLWDLNVSSWRERARQIANRNLTEDEWEQFMGQGSGKSIIKQVLRIFNRGI